MAVDVRPVPTSRGQGTDMMITFVSYLNDVRFITDPDQQFTQFGNFMALTGIQFLTPAFVAQEYACLLSEDAAEPVRLAMFMAPSSAPTDWGDFEEQYFLISGRFHPNALRYQREVVDGAEEDVGDMKDVYTRLVLGRDFSLQPVEYRAIPSDPKQEAPFPFTSPITSFYAVVDTTTFTWRDDFPFSLEDRKAMGFAKISTYIKPAAPKETPYEGYHIAHVLILCPIKVQPWTSMCRWMYDKGARGPFQPNTAISVTGRFVGLLDLNCLTRVDKIDETVHIPIIIADSWKFHTVSAASAPPSASTPGGTPRAQRRTGRWEADAQSTKPQTPTRSRRVGWASESVPSTSSTTIEEVYDLTHERSLKRPASSPTSAIEIEDDPILVRDAHRVQADDVLQQSIIAAADGPSRQHSSSSPSDIQDTNTPNGSPDLRAQQADKRKDQDNTRLETSGSPHLDRARKRPRRTTAGQNAHRDSW